MNHLLQTLRNSVQAVPALHREYLKLLADGKVNTLNKKVRCRLHYILVTDSVDLQTQLTRQLNLTDRIEYLFSLSGIREVFSIEFVQSIENYSKEWEQALLEQAENKNVQELITEILALPYEMKRLIDNDRGEYPPNKVECQHDYDPTLEIILKYHRLGRLNELFKKPDQKNKKTNT